MSTLESFLARCEKYLHLRKSKGLRPWTEATLSARLFNNGGKIAQIRAGKDVYSGTLDAAGLELTALERQARQHGGRRRAAASAAPDAEASS